MNLSKTETNEHPNLQKILSIGEEVVNVDELNKLLLNKENIIAYDGFEPSGRMHLAQGLLRAHNVNKFTSSGVRFKKNTKCRKINDRDMESMWNEFRKCRIYLVI